MNSIVFLLTISLATTIEPVFMESIVDEDLEQVATEVLPNDKAERCVALKTCPANEEFRCCGPCYQLTCHGSVVDCGGRCFAECYCVKGFVRLYSGGPCTPQHFCDYATQPIRDDYEYSDNDF